MNTIAEPLQPCSTDLADGSLAQIALTGNQMAFEILVERYHTSLFNYVCHMLGDYDQASDILQQVFLRFYSALPLLKTEKPFKAWLFQVAYHCCIDELRRKSKYPIPFSQLATDDFDQGGYWIETLPDPQPLPEELLEREELQNLLQQTIASLPPKFRTIVVCRYLHQLRFKEIAHILDIPEATAKIYFHRAKKLLRAKLTPKNSIERSHEVPVLVA